MKARDMRELGAAELGQLIRERKQELEELRIKHASSMGIDKAVRLRHLRREIARMLTIQKEREAK